MPRKLSYSKCGVSDLEQDNSPMSMPSGQFRPVSTRAYDYADFGGHQYEELPHSRVKSMVPQPSPESPDSKSEYQSSSGTTVTTEPSETDDTAAIVRNSEQRKRYNPLYDAMINSSPSIYNKVKSISHKDSAVMKELKLLRIIIILLLLISFTALALSLYLIIAINAGLPDVENLKQELGSLQSQYDELSSKFNTLERITTGNKSFEYLKDLSQQVQKLESQTSEKISNLEKDFQNTSSVIQVNQDEMFSYVYNNITSVIDKFSTDVRANLSTISKMPGPQGPRGVGDLTLCFMKNVTERSRSGPGTSTTTQRLPTDADLQKHVAMFATCSVDGGLYQHLSVYQTNNSVKFSCTCSGEINGIEYRVCKLYILLCPRESFGAS